MCEYQMDIMLENMRSITSVVNNSNNTRITSIYLNHIATNYYILPARLSDVKLFDCISQCILIRQNCSKNKFLWVDNRVSNSISTKENVLNRRQISHLIFNLCDV